MKHDRTLIVVLGDQLSPDLASLRSADPARDMVLMAEVSDEATYVPHHKKKLAFVLSAMRHFGSELRAAGWQVRYVKLDDPANTGSLTGEIERCLQDHPAREVCVVQPGEYRLHDALIDAAETWAATLRIMSDDRFLSTPEEFRTWAEGRKQLRMEYFYRDMRRRSGILMEGAQPIGGKWNYDSENRKPARGDLFMPQLHRVEPDSITSEVLELVAARFPDNFGELTPFWYAVTRTEASLALDHFVAHALPKFGDYQDAMLQHEPFLYHSVLAQYINIGLLDAREVCARVEAAFHAEHAPLNAVEGFIRQIIGWREYMRGIYWLEGPDYTRSNHLQAQRPLPSFYWTGDTDMSCMSAAIKQTREESYAHHIQRLMVTGNFALLAGINPFEVHEWYLAVYADAYEWVEAPNVIGMSQFADGGRLGSKPYAASGNYINKMSDYCKTCHYDVRQKTGPTACPFNPLYWDFLDRNADALRGNPRLGNPYRTWDRMDPIRQEASRQSAKAFLDSLC